MWEEVIHCAELCNEEHEEYTKDAGARPIPLELVENACDEEPEDRYARNCRNDVEQRQHRQQEFHVVDVEIKAECGGGATT